MRINLWPLAKKTAPVESIADPQVANICAAIERELGKTRTQRNKLGRPFKAPPAAGLESVVACEQALGLEIPPILREVYLNVANGGFGPGYGVIGVPGGFSEGCGTLVDLIAEIKRQGEYDPAWEWQRSWLPFCHWGCGVYSVVDCVAPYPVFFLDVDAKQEGTPMSSIIFPHKDAIGQWFGDWLVGKDLWRQVWR